MFKRTPQHGIATVAREQLGVCAHLGDAVAVEHDDAVGARGCAQPMGDHQRGAPFGQLLQRALEELAAGRTTLVIAHRLSTAARADRIIVLDGDHISETGVHADLLTRNGRYSMLWRAFEHGVAVGAN